MFWPHGVLNKMQIQKRAPICICRTDAVKNSFLQMDAEPLILIICWCSLLSKILICKTSTLRKQNKFLIIPLFKLRIAPHLNHVQIQCRDFTVVETCIFLRKGQPWPDFVFLKASLNIRCCGRILVYITKFIYM